MSLEISFSTFARHIAALGGLPSKLVIALSGGSDSMCLAFLLAKYRDLHSPEVSLEALTIDHGYRSGSEVEARNVGQIVEKWGIRHTVHKLSWQTDPRLLSNFEEAARIQRLRALWKFSENRGIKAVFMGHNQNDLVETYLQRLQMNSTVYGLVGLKAKSEFPDPDSARSPYLGPMSIYRPLLPFDKTQIVATCRSHQVPWVEDSSNADIHLTKRNWLRYTIANVLPSRPGLSCIALPSLVQTVSELQDFLAFLETQVAAQHFSDFTFDRRRNRLTFSMTTSEFWGYEHLDFLVFSRWLFYQISPLSASKHLHWSYAKIHRSFVPALAEFVRSEKKVGHFCYLNVKMHVTKHEHRLRFVAANEVPRNYELAVTSDWSCFGRLWWMKSSGPAYTARFYHPDLKKQILASFPTWRPREITKDLANVPVLMDGDRIVGVPTWNRWVQDVSVTCVPITHTRRRLKCTVTQ